MSDTPTLHDLYHFPRVKGLSFWCTEYSCRSHEVWDVGRMAIDWGPCSNLADLKEVSHCLACGADEMSVVPNWGEGGQSWFERLTI